MALGSYPFYVRDPLLEQTLSANDGGGGGNAVSVLLGNGNGTFQAKHDYTAGTSPNSVEVADFNGDGELDLVVAAGGSNLADILLGNGNGTFQAKRDYATGNNPSSVELADLNGDGKWDFMSADLDGDGECAYWQREWYVSGQAGTHRWKLHLHGRCGRL